MLSVTGFEQGNMDIKAYVINQNLKDFANVASFNKMNVTISFTNESPHQALNIINMTD